jgi:hypothetical protein
MIMMTAAIIHGSIYISVVLFIRIRLIYAAVGTQQGARVPSAGGGYATT